MKINCFKHIHGSIQEEIDASSRTITMLQDIAKRTSLN